MALRCTGCRADIPARFVDIDRVLAQCRSCGRVFDFSAQVAPLPVVHPMARTRLEIPCPPGITLEQADGTLRLRVPWLSPELWWRLLVGGVFGLFLAGTVLNVVGSTALGRFLGAWMLIFTPFVLGILGGVYLVLMHVFNQTEIRVDAECLRTRSGPLPWAPARQLAVGALDQLFCKADRRLSLGSNTYCQNMSYSLVARMHDGSQVSLLTGLVEPDYVWFVEQRIEEFLGIEDRHIRGEFR